MSIFVALSTFGGVNGAMLTTSRIFFVAGEEQQMPRLMAFLQIHQHASICRRLHGTLHTSLSAI